MSKVHFVAVAAISAVVGATISATIIYKLARAGECESPIPARTSTSSIETSSRAATPTPEVAWTAVSIPFFHPDCPSLPTAEQIRSSSNVLGKRPNGKVVRFDDNIIVKFGSGIEIAEGQTLLYLERHVPTVPAPRLYAMFQDSSDTFLVMQYMPGTQLDHIWPTLSDLEKSSVTTLLRQTFETMRRTECPWPDFFGGCDGGGMPHYLFASFKPGEGNLGPFSSERELNQALARNYRALKEQTGYPNFKVHFYERHLPTMLQGHRAVLTHADVQRKNILVEEKDSINGQRVFAIYLVDWETAGWYPEYWEYFDASGTFDHSYWEDDWCGRVEDFLQAWPIEMAIMRMVDKDLLF